MTPRPTIRVNPIACQAHGLCAEILPERIALDEWGYPIVDGEPLARDLLAHARRAAQVCPTLALIVQSERSAEPAEPAAGRSRDRRGR